MEQQDKIGIKEFTALVIILLATQVADDTPSILFEQLYNAGWMAPLINGVITLVPILLLFQVVFQYKNKGLIDVINDVFGKYIGYIIIFLLWVELFMGLILHTAVHTDILDTMYFVKTPTIIIYAVFMIVCAYGAKRGFNHIGSVAWLVYPYVQVIFFVALLLTIGEGNVDFLFPLFGPGLWEVLKESGLRLSIYSDLLTLFFLVPMIKSEKEFRKGTWIALAIIIFNLFLGMISYVFLFDYKSVMQLNYPFHEVIRTISLGFLTNLETFYLPFFLMASFVKISIYLYVVALLFGYLFKVKEFEYIIPTLATIIVFIGIMPESPSFTLFQLRDVLLLLETPIFFFLPILLWVVAKIKGVFKHDKAKKPS